MTREEKYRQLVELRQQQICRSDCKNKFTQGQKERMLATIKK
jgi:hypothetical protein